MTVVKINAIEVPSDAGPELEKRFAHRAHAVDNQPGFLGFQLLRPVKGEDRYFVVTQWESEEAFQAWATGPAVHAHAGERANPVATGATLLEFEVVLDVAQAGRLGARWRRSPPSRRQAPWSAVALRRPRRR
jgi:heme oxygenase (mycobilin-producing)